MNLKSELRLDWASFRACAYACRNWHYSGGMPGGKLVKIGVWESGVFIGVVIFGCGTSASLLNRFGLSRTQGCELVRIALDRHKNSVSTIISIAVKMLRRQSPGLKLLVSFADKSKNHHGGIYQASNWIYEGSTNFKQEYFLDGKAASDRTVSQLVTGLGTSRRQLISENRLVKAPTRTKHRYLMALDAEMAAKIRPLARQYPKRAKQAMAVPTAQRQGSADPHAPTTKR